jgi:phage terminase large subunit-like protein
LLEEARKTLRLMAQLRIPKPVTSYLQEALGHLVWTYSFQKLLARECELMLAGAHDKQHIAITTPPRHGKTSAITIPLPAYKMQYWPGSEVIVATHSQSLVNHLSRRTRRIVQDRIGIASDAAAVKEWQASNDSSYKGIGVGGYLSGRGGNLIVADDLVPNRKSAESLIQREALKDWWDNDLYTRRNPGTHCPIILIMTRWHPEDIWSHVVKPDTWQILRLPAICDYSSSDPDDYCRIPDPLQRQPGDVLCPGLWPMDKLMQIKAAVSEYTWLSLYQGRPTWRDGLFFEVSKFSRSIYTEPIIKRVRFYDLAASDDPDACYTASVRMAYGKTGQFVIEHVDRIQAGPAERDRWQRRLATQDHRQAPDGVVQIEELQPGAAGKDRARQFARVMRGFAHAVYPATGDKVTRADPYAAHVGAGMVTLLEIDCFGENQKKRLSEFITEHAQFPLSSQKDYVDSASGGFSYLNRRRGDRMEVHTSEAIAAYQPGARVSTWQRRLDRRRD